MLTHKQALQKIARETGLLKPAALPLSECLGKIAAENIFSPIDFPNFDNSAVDGYAVCLKKDETKDAVVLKVLGEIPAGQYFAGTLKPGQAMQIFTGAPVPKGTDAVVMQEKVERWTGSVKVFNRPEAHQNVRFSGEDFPKGALLVKKSTWLGPAHLAVLATAGHATAKVYPSPQVAVLVTGSELLKPGDKPGPGRIYDSNSVLLDALVRQAGGIPSVISSTGDELKNIRTAVRRGLQADVLIVSGGVSVGKYDFVKEAMEKEGVREIFWKVDIKPGKPLYFGKKGNALVFGLPGNPVSVFVTFEEFVKPALLKMSGKSTDAKWVEGKLAAEFRNGPRPHFVRVRCEKSKNGFRVTPLRGQGSHQIGSLAKANAILKIDADQTLDRGQKVRVKVIA